MAVIIPNVVAETPELGQGDTVASPSPDPRAASSNPIEAMTNAPPIMAPHETADAFPSAPVSRTRPPRGSAAVLVTAIFSASARTAQGAE